MICVSFASADVVTKVMHDSEGGSANGMYLLRWRAEGFNHTENFCFDTIAVELKREGTGLLANFSIQNDDGSDDPDGTDIAIGEFNATAISTDYTWHNVTLNETVEYTAGTDMHIVGIPQNIGDGDNAMTWHGISSDNYVNGTFHYTSDGGAWVDLSRDLHFKIYNTSCEGGGEPGGEATGTSISLSQPYGNWFFQRDNSTHGEVIFEGTYENNVTCVEGNFSNSDWITINDSITSSPFTGRASFPIGQGIITVRDCVNTTATDTVSISIGELFVIGGQSNAQGQGDEARSLNGSNMYVAKNYDGTNWVDANDPIDDNTNIGSHWSLVADYLTAYLEVPIGYIADASEGAGIIDWTKGETGYYDELVDMVYNGTLGTKKVKAVLYHQGEADARTTAGDFRGVNGSYNDYKYYGNLLADDFVNDTNAEVVLMGQIGHRKGSVAPGNIKTVASNIRLAQSDLWAEDNNITGGALCYDMNTSDDVHFKTNQELDKFGQRWFYAIQHYLYGEDTKQPEIQQIQLLSDNVMELEFDKNLTFEAWNGDTGAGTLYGFELNISGNYYNQSDMNSYSIDGTKLTINWTITMNSTNATLSFGRGNDAYNHTIIRDNETQQPPIPFIKHSILDYEEEEEENVPPTNLTARISPSLIYNETTLQGYCNATDAEGNNLTYYYRWFNESVIAFSGSVANKIEGIEYNINNLSNTYTDIGENWTFSCFANDGEDNSSSWTNSTTEEVYGISEDSTSYCMIDDFNRVDNGSVGEGWEEAEFPSTQVSIYNNTLKFNDTSVENYVSIEKGSLNISSSSLKFRFKYDVGSGRYIFTTRDESNNIRIRLEIYGNNNTLAFNNGTSIGVTELSDSDWFNISLRNIDYSEDRYDIYLNNALVYDNASMFIKNGNYFENIRIQTTSAEEFFGQMDFIQKQCDVVNNVELSFKDIDTLSLIDFKTISLGLISDDFSSNYTTTNGTLHFTNITIGDYIFRSSADGYEDSLNYFTIEEDTNITTTIYMINDSISSEVTITIYDYSGLLVPNVFVKSLKFDIINNSYNTIELSKTNSIGQVTHSLSLYDEYYKFMIYDDSRTYLITNPEYITSESIDFSIDTGVTLFFNYNDDFLNLDYDLYFNETSNYTIYTYNNIDNLATQTCLSVYKIDGIDKTELYEQCSTAASNTLSYLVNDVDLYRFEAIATYTDTEGNDLFIDIISFGAESPSIDFKTEFIIWQIVLSLVIVGVAIYTGPEMILLSIPVSLVIGRIIGFNPMNWTALIILTAVMVILTFIVHKRR